MKKILLRVVVGLAIFMPNVIPATNEAPSVPSFAFTAKGIPKYDTIKCWISCIGNEPVLAKVANLVKFDLEFTDQFAVDLKQTEKVLSETTHEKLFNDGTSLCGYLQVDQSESGGKKDETPIKVTLYDTASKMVVFEKKYEISKQYIPQVHAMSADLLECLTQSRGVCEGTMAYTKTCSPLNKTVCIADYVGNTATEKIIVNDNAINVALSWHSKAPVLFYSRLHQTTSKLFGFNLTNKQKKVVCSYKGLNMQPSFSADGKKSVMCISSGATAQLYLYDKHEGAENRKRHFRKLTNNDGANASPILLPNDNVIFCSDFETGSPQIYFLNTKKHTMHRLTNGEGYCAAPSFCPKTKMLTYGRLLDGTFQIFALSLSKTDHAKGVERQLTFGPGDKYEPVLSACGQYVYCLYSPQGIANRKSPAQVAVLNTRSGKLRPLTSSKESKGFPAFTANAWYTLA